jgi:hypothetical protein
VNTRVADIDEENRLLKDRNSRLIHANQELQQGLAKADAELSQLRVSKQRETEEAKFQAERSRRLTEMIERHTQELDNSRKLGIESQGTVLDLQRLLKQKDDTIEALESKLTSVQNDAQRTKLEVALAKNLQQRYHD